MVGEGRPRVGRGPDARGTYHPGMDAEPPLRTDAARRSPRWAAGMRWALLGLALSLPVHASILAWMAMTGIDRPGVPRPSRAPIELAVLPEDGIEDDAAVAAAAGAVAEGPEVASTAASMEAALADPLATGGVGEGTGLGEGGADGFGGFGAGGGGGDGLGGGGTGGGGGGGGGSGLGGGAGGTSFFGVGGRGTRFAYVVDKSASMRGRIAEAKQELYKSIVALPDFASVYVVFYDSSEPWAFSDRWERVRSSTVQRLKGWLKEVGPSGGTEPVPAFRMVFALDVRPDVIFFLSDGEIPPESIAQIRQLNARGRRVTINSIAFGEEAGSQQLRQVAQEADGQFREVRPQHPGERP